MVKPIAISVDPVDKHKEWIGDINETQNTTVNFPILADADRKVAELVQTRIVTLTEATPLASWWRHERGARIYDGADEVHKTAVARRILAEHGMKRGEE